jgi:hypothetical protein
VNTSANGIALKYPALVRKTSKVGVNTAKNALPRALLKMLVVKSLGISFLTFRDFRQKTTEKPSKMTLIIRRTTKDDSDRFSH